MLTYTIEIETDNDNYILTKGFKRYSEVLGVKYLLKDLSKKYGLRACITSDLGDEILNTFEQD